MSVNPTEAHCTGLFNSLLASVSVANTLPKDDDNTLIRTLSETAETLVTLLNADIEDSLKRLENVYTHATDRETPSRNDIFSLSHDLIERSVEQFNLSMDDYNGVRGRTNPNHRFTPNLASRHGSLYPKVRPPHYSTIPKPQLQFPDYPIDNSETPFIPPHSTNLEPARTLGSRSSDPVAHTHLKHLYANNSATNQPHPFKHEIAQFVQSRPPTSNTAIRPPAPFNQTPFSFISTEEELMKAVSRFREASEIAVDLENHSERSFQGFTCLMQVSTRTEDFVIDTLKLRGLIHQHLAPIFSDKNVLKVMHGADHDVEWLERDFGIYLVGLFDTGQAARLLQFPSAALSHLLTRFCRVNTSQKKKFQLADWRLRPIPSDMMAYARSDTHYLLFIYDNVRLQLEKASLLQTCWVNSANICLKRYRKPSYNLKPALDNAKKQGFKICPRQFRLLDALCKWRDRIAREEDESPHYVAPVKLLTSIVNVWTRCCSRDGLLSQCAAHGYIPPFMQRDALTLAAIFKEIENENVPLQSA